MNKRIYETMHLSDEKIQKLLFILILILGIGARLWMFGDVPGGINQDEAFAAREAWSLLHYGKDSFGYSYPMYLTAWGSGMNALNTYLMMPFIALFGMHTWVFRLPQMLIGILSLFAIEEIVSKVAGWKCSLLAMFLLAVSPRMIIKGSQRNWVKLRETDRSAGYIGWNTAGMDEQWHSKKRSFFREGTGWSEFVWN